MCPTVDSYSPFTWYGVTDAENPLTQRSELALCSLNAYNTFSCLYNMRSLPLRFIRNLHGATFLIDFLGQVSSGWSQRQHVPMRYLGSEDTVLSFMHIFLFILLSHSHDQKYTMRGEIQTRMVLSRAIFMLQKKVYILEKDTENTKLKKCIKLAYYWPYMYKTYIDKVNL